MKKIKFIPRNEIVNEIYAPPEPAIKNLANWYKNLKPYVFKNKSILMENKDLNLSVKKCVPFFDAISAGYIIPLPCDILVEKIDDTVRFKWFANTFEPLSYHPIEQSIHLPTPENCYQQIFKWLNGWIIKTPPGYSLWICHPSNRNDLPFITITGFVDTDKYDTATNLPFFMKNNFEGIIPKGTPIAQIIPVKRDTWQSSLEKLTNKYFYSWERIAVYIGNAYRRFFWQRKYYR